MPTQPDQPLEAASPLLRPRPLLDLKTLNRFPGAARQRELIKLVDKVSGNGVHLFIHYTSPILEARRKTLLASGTTKKKYPKSTSQLWTTLDDEQRGFWDHQVKLIRLGIANRTLGHEHCVEDAGFRSEWKECLRFSENSVATYLQLPLPTYLQETEDSARLAVLDAGVDATKPKDEPPIYEIKKLDTIDIECGSNESRLEKSTAPLDLLDTIREPFTAEPRIIYGNFAQLYPYDSIRRAEGKHQTALLRQLADLLDPTGKEFFYYYATPHLWKSIRPTDLDETIASVAHRLWMLMPGTMKKQWATESARAKKLLGDGNVDGLNRLRLERDCEEVWKLHEMAEEAMKVELSKRSVGDEDVGLEDAD
ncbi:hypothetical protein M409DRAFT_21061 [Zasmidium cellare ATCC 36951]|uniref:Uncharacterized protein n=1 Tax=Zasmidium cellare ATCC 36951 TaxID=1080233 RepID=A0A6A6CT87_ZASCE|nr:uncharacterized protein M409DRAFT_21061 [Zasmidium cellare ATCC 36951]KAF2169052.1 hypothetical protein M409DRAFT_21061 [Zasmidium cellare ATCC 36951]